ncbi:GL10067 [Drosophila persimilis]|uniref:GL10067 n=1 Tax=Drosophila persimilis TaxID=7234 RepID=B4IRX8_DROPE|nr:GL10067 [Drosophila persimilis]
MGQSYFCDYCGCFMKSDLNVRKLHNNGISHTVAKYRYMRRFEDAAKILAEERLKNPCQRYSKGILPVRSVLQLWSIIVIRSPRSGKS